VLTYVLYKLIDLVHIPDTKRN